MEKSNRKVLIMASIIVLLTIIMIGLIIFVYFNHKKQEDINNKPVDINNALQQIGENNSEDTTKQEYTEDDFTLTTNYVGDSTWTYTITGQLPNACYDASSNAVVMESYPEQVNINLQVEKVGDTCAQVIQELDENGTFQASEEAQVTFNVSSD